MLKNGLIRQSSILFISIIMLMAALPLMADNMSESKKSYEQCGLNEKSRKLAKQVIEDPDQQRENLICSPMLAKIAQNKAEEMAAQGKVSHYGPGGSPDERLLKAGYNLYLPKDAIGLNHVEAIQGGSSRAGVVLDKFKNSYQHRVHLFAEHSFFLQQNEIGVGYAYEWNSPHVDYWVIYIASQKNHRDQKKRPAGSKHVMENDVK